VPLVIVFVGSLLGLAVAGLPSRREDAPLSVQTATSTVASTTATAPPATPATTAPPPPATPATTAPPPSAAARNPADLKVRAFNSSSVTGAATKMGARLKSLGYVVVTPGPDRKPPQDASVVMYRDGLEAEARALASSLGLDAGVVTPIEAPVAAVGETDLAVLVGSELARRTP